MGIIEDFDYLYTTLLQKHKLQFLLSCQHQLERVHIESVKTYFCCAVTEKRQCVLHGCVVVIVGTWLDKQFRGEDSCYGFEGTFIIEGRHFSFPNIMMNNNILIHNFYDKQYAREKKMKRMFLYGNYDDEKAVNRAIQLVYDKVDDVLYVRDVYAKDYIVDNGINEVLRDYLMHSGKWSDMDFVFSFENYSQLFEQLKRIMSVDINYQIDSLSNKLIFKHSYLLQLTYDTILNKKREGKKNILFPIESKKIYDTIVMGKLIQSVSKTLSKQKKYDQDYNSNNNNYEIMPLKNRIGNEVLRIVNENLQQDMLKHTPDYIKFVDSFFHGEMTVAGKKFFLCHDTTLPNVDYKLVSDLFKELIEKKMFFENNNNNNNNNTSELVLVSFNNRPTKYYCHRESLITVYYTLKRAFSPIELRLNENVLFVNHHEGMVMLKKVVCIDDTIFINTLQTPYEYHNRDGLVKDKTLKFVESDNTTSSLMSTMILDYYKNHLHIFNTIPVSKLIVSLTNLKNGMVVQKKDYKKLPLGNSAVVDSSVYCNDRMFYLWTLVMDSGLKTAEDPYIPHTQLPIEIYYNKVNRVRGKTLGDGGGEVVYRKSEKNNIIEVEGDNYLCLFGTLVSDNKINWNHDGRKFKIEYCMSKQWHVYKFYMYFRSVGQIMRKINSSISCEDNGVIMMKLEMVYSTTNLEGMKICGIHGQKGVLNGAEDLSEFVAEDDSTVHAQICLSPVSYMSRQTNFHDMPVKYCRIRSVRYPMILVPYMFFNNTPDNIFKEFIGHNITGYEKLEGTRLDQWSINQSFVGNRLSEGLHCVRNGNNSGNSSGQYNVFQTLLHCNNIKID
ncbi:late expression factor 8 [Diatraea saccharalis granulovirus]|uniref:Late expression factor 8 n=1 Tax=Diatraea saccharalis granulovirus TaxID=1675862 RepID=A0A0R7EZ79_9BBAC|nr:late expression factor 8 [Diatraea saccharalis granulovirus]AKN80823.1 late expression factor 8 [Diatraea saccharalis granulovirus]